MAHTLRFSTTLFYAPLMIAFAACNDSAPNNNERTQNAPPKDTLATAKWENPRNGKIYDKVNYVQIPLTALENHLLGPIKSVRYTDYSISEKDGTKAFADSGYNVYDKAGHLVDQNEYDKTGKFKWHCTYTYDEQNRAVKWDFKFDDNKRNSVASFKYDDKGRQTERNEVAADAKWNRRTEFIYNEQGHLVTENDYRGKDNKPWVTTYEYDSRGFEKVLTLKDATGEVQHKTSKEYDDKGRGLSGKYYKDDTTVEGSWVAKLDSKGRATETVYYRSDGTPDDMIKHKYDDWDNITEMMRYTPSGSVDTNGFNAAVEYEYDDHGNPVKETWYRIKDGKKVMTNLVENKYGYY